MTQLQIDRPLISFDIESTGVDVVQDRIIQLAAVKIEPPDLFVSDWREDRKVWLLNPGRSIPPESTKIHHITDDMVKDKPHFREVAGEIMDFFGTADLLGYNLLKMDVQMLWEEFHRRKIEWDVDKLRIVDAATIFAKKEPRNLAAAVQKYAGREHVDAHDAMVDAVANLDVFKGQLAAYEDLGRMGIGELAAYSQEVEFEGQPAKRLDLSGHIIQGADGIPRYTMARVRGVPVEKDSGFGIWMLRQDWISEHTKRVLRKLLNGDDLF